ncbi:N-formylglutamate amidohydrolase [Aristophania vespae]|uniref:N-formylglutamate amidohydrolase n=1 Tax=Aristophania vespae TaxID=2697033 RepID=UPI002351210C|nr:N-formylglutamate amidohydrolase [Aristophania vespae]UMM63334.1 hypothetical protein DM15PD_02920 [Aristophania vespae]
MAFLSDRDPLPYIKRDALKNSPFILVSDHAGRIVPEKLGDMGVSRDDWERHISHDIGIKGVGHYLHKLCGSVLIEQVYSRLVIDCNRSPGHPTSIASVSDNTNIPANQSVSEDERRARERTILHPYHDVIEREIDQRKGSDNILISLHSFTPEMNGFKRPWHIGLLHDHDPLTAQIMIDMLKEDKTLCVGDNEPYILNSVNDYTVPYHAARRQMPALEIEIRQDLIAHETGQKEWAERLANLLPRVWDERKRRGNL